MDLLDRIAPVTSISPPAGMVLVTQEQFFAFLKQDPRDIMPSARNRDFSVWETRDMREIGRTYPGWNNPGDETGYFLTESAKATMKS